MEEGGRTAAVALVADLMFASRVSGAARVAGVEVVTVGKAERSAGADRVLARSAFVRELPALLRGDRDAGPPSPE